MIEYLLGEPIFISDSQKIYRYKVNDNIFTGDIKPKSSVFVNSRISCEFKSCEFINLSIDYKPRNKESRGFLDDFKKNNNTYAIGKVDVIIDNPDYNMVNSRFCVRDVKTEATLTKHDSRYYWKLNVNNYDIFDKLVEKVSNIMPIINCSEVYEKDYGIALTTEKMKVKMILDYYWNLLDKERRENICEKVRNALRYL